VSDKGLRVTSVLRDRLPAASPRLRPPATPPSALERKRLLCWLTDDPAPVTLVCGHAGAGKTSLLAGWASAATAAGQVVAWYGVERFDDDPGLLWSGILDALRATGAFPPGSALHDLAAAPHEVGSGFLDAVTAAIEALGTPVWLVLDDVHLLTSRETVGSLDRLARRAASDRFRLVLASRSDPPIGLPRLRVEGRLRELRGQDLAFTHDETAAYLAGRGLDLPDTALHALQQRTEGWAAGIRIATLALEGSDDQRQTLERFAGDDHAVADYLVTEVLANVPVDLRRFLLRTSVCTHLRVDLAHELSGREDAGAVLDALARDHLFTLRVGRNRDGYRYHELFRTFLLAELRRTDAADERTLHRTAAAWHAARAETLQAVDHLVRGGHLEAIPDLVGPDAVGAILDGHAEALGGLLESIELRGRGRTVPTVALLGAAAAMELGDLDVADGWLDRVDEDELEDSGDEALITFAATVAVWRARASDQVAGALARLEASSAGATGIEEYDLLALHERGIARLYLGRYDEAVEDLRQAARLARRTGREALLLSCRSFEAGALGCRSELIAMRAEADGALELAQRRGWAGTQPVAHAHLLVGWSALLTADRALATQHTQLAVAALGPLVDPDVELGVRSLALLIAAEDGHGFEALSAYRVAFERLASAQVAPALLAYLAPEVLRVCLDLGERSWAQLLVERISTASPDPGEPALLRAMLVHDAGRYDAARAALAPVVRGDAACHVVTTAVRAHLLAAELEHRRGALARTHELLGAAVELAAPVTLVRPFVEHRSSLELLSEGRGRFGRHDPFVEQVLDAVPPLEGGQAVERLTPGELAVLRELPSLLSLPEIADARAVSVNTVKTHLRSIYRKLGVDGRRTAVETARRRGLL
jgi:LuxR family transcriptional regulator, maltose regulon positive regulatory protein